MKHIKNMNSVLYIKTIKEYSEKTSLFTVGLIPLNQMVLLFDGFVLLHTLKVVQLL